MAELPLELIFNEILPRIPIKSLLKFKSVCCQWNAIISTTQFAKTHVHHPSSHSSRSVLTLEIDALFFEAVDYGGFHLKFNKFGKNFGGPLDWLIASCDGLAFLISASDELQIPDLLHCYDFRYVVYNPVLGIDDFVEIDHPFEFVLGGSTSVSVISYNFGFGYVSSLDDYCIAAVNLPLTPRRPEVIVYVYSLRSQLWMTPRKFKQSRLPLEFQDPWYRHSATLVKETLHWPVTRGKDQKLIAAFDLATQSEFKMMQLPDEKFGDGGVYHSAFSLCCLDDCLCACARYDDGEVVELWMLKEYGVHESWTKLFRFDQCFSYRDFYGLTESGLVLIFNDDKLMLADFTCDPPNCWFIGLENKFCAVSYVQSLVSVLAITSEPRE